MYGDSKYFKQLSSVKTSVEKQWGRVKETKDELMGVCQTIFLCQIIFKND